MSEVTLLHRVGAHVRAEQEGDALFERIARGEASAEELAEVEANADLALRLEASRPLDAGAVDRITAKVTRAPAPEPAAVRPAGRLHAFRRRAVVVAGPLALAAAALLYLGRGRAPSLASHELPSYSVVAHGEQTMRGPGLEEQPSTRLVLGRAGGNARFEVLLRPATAPRHRVVAFAFAIGEAGPSEPIALDAKIEISEEGAVRITGPAKILAGARELRIVLGASTSIESYDDALARASAGRAILVPIER